MNKSRKVFSFIIFAIILCSTFSSTLATVLAEKTDELEKKSFIRSSIANGGFYRKSNI